MSKWYQFWRYHPRFYRGFRTNRIFPELYWVISLEAFLILGGLAVILSYAIPESLRARERIQKSVERYRESKERSVMVDPAPVSSPAVPPTGGQPASQDLSTKPPLGVVP